VRVEWESVLLEPPPSLLTLRRRYSVFVRMIPRCRVGGGAQGRPRANLRPPLTLHVQISRMQRSRRCSLPRGQRRNYIDQVDKPILAVERPLRQPLPASITPAFVAVRPNTSDDPTVEAVEE